MNLTSKIKKCSILQHDSSDCGPACLVSIIRYYGGSANIENIRKSSGTSQYGTSMLGLYHAAQKHGLDATGYEASISDIIDYKGVLVLHITLDTGLEHYVIDYGYENGKFITWDPANGVDLKPREELERIWQSKKCLGLVPNSTFVKFKEDNSRKKTWLKDIIRPDFNLLITSIVIGIAISILSLVMAVFSQKLIDKILPAKNINLLVATISLVFILLLARLILNAVRQQILLYQGKAFNIRIVENFFGSLLYLPKTFFDTRKTGDLIGRLNDTMRIQRVIAEFVSIYLIDLLIMLVTITGLFFYSKMAAFLTLFCIPVFFVLVYRWNNRIISAQNEVMSGYAYSESNYIDSIQGITEIKSMNWQNIFKEKNKIIYSDFQDKAFYLGEIRIRLGLLTGIIGTSYLIMVLFNSSVLVINSKMTSGELLAILSLSSTILPSILNLVLVSIPVSEAKVAISRMFEFSQVDPEDKESDGSINPVDIEKLKLENISFRFPGQKLLLEDINLEIERGKIISIVGESGCGKSTLANIILRFYHSETGNIILNGKLDSMDINLKNWRYSVAIIPQEIHIFNGTILQNLLTEINESKINHLNLMISEFGLTGFVDSFPAGMMTNVGEEGINLSGGQKQLIAFIRVLINKPDILVIDEGTSNMDRGTERIICKLIRTLRNKMGILFISHKLNLVKNLSDFIYVLENRTTSAKGTHDELVRYNNLYKRFWDDFY